MSIKQKIKKSVQFAKDIAARNILFKIIVAVICGVVIVITKFLNAVFDISGGNALIAAILFVLSVYITRKINKEMTNPKEIKIVCKNCVALINKSDEICFNCGARVRKNNFNNFVDFTALTIIIFAILLVVFRGLFIF
jgi:hypothetical protein